MEVDYEKMSLEQFKQAYLIKRETIFSKMNNMGSIKAEKIMIEEYETLSADAVGGDVVAQDLIAQWYRNGNQVVPENIEYAMKWQIIAGANGNKYSLERMKLYFGFAFDTIINLSDFGKIANKFNIDMHNYQYVLGKLICDGIIDDMKFNALELAKGKASYLPYNPETMHKFDKAVNNATTSVIAYLRKK